MKKPIIGITSPNKRICWGYWLIKFSVWLCGGIPKPLKTLVSINKYRVDGLVLGGGTDVYPDLFNEIPKNQYNYDHTRDETELSWLRKAEIEELPVLAICRGAQMMNVMNKGTLHMDVEIAYEKAHYPKSLWRRLFFRKSIYIKDGSLLSRLVNAKHLRVNSMHTQSIYKLGNNLEITAKEENNVIQAIERPGHPFYLGVQFHPEFMIYRPTMQAIFKGLIRATYMKI